MILAVELTLGRRRKPLSNSSKRMLEHLSRAGAFGCVGGSPRPGVARRSERLGIAVLSAHRWPRIGFHHAIVGAPAVSARVWHCSVGKGGEYFRVPNPSFNRTPVRLANYGIAERGAGQFQRYAA